MDNYCEVYRDDHYILELKDNLPFIIINGKEYGLSCHPYEPCLYITDKDGSLTAVHNSFDPSSTLKSFSEGSTVRSITGKEYTALDFCKMVEYAAGKYDIQIDDAEKVFGTYEKKKKPDPTLKAEYTENTVPLPEYGRIIEEDAFHDAVEKYPDSVVDFCLVRNEDNATGYNAHRAALLWASRKLFIDDDDSVIWHFDISKASAKEIGTDELFAPKDNTDKMNYRKAFLCPPYPNKYSDSDFDKINSVLFPNGTDKLEVYEWTCDWSEYFDEGHEWWGTLCLTVYDKTLDRFAVIMASATD